MEKTDLIILRSKLDSALSVVATELGLEIKLGAIRYGSNNASASLRINQVNADGYPMTKEADAFLAHAPLLGFDKDDLFREFMKDGSLYALMGYKTRATKNPFLVRELATDKNYVVNEHWIKSALDYPMGSGDRGLTSADLSFK